MSNHAETQPPLTIDTLKAIVEHYPVDSSFHGQPLLRNLRTELEERTTFFIAHQLQIIRTALPVIIALLFLSTISIAKIVVGVRLSDPMSRQASDGYLLNCSRCTCFSLHYCTDHIGKVSLFGML
jgi:hypothetical protein